MMRDAPTRQTCCLITTRGVDVVIADAYRRDFSGAGRILRAARCLKDAAPLHERADMARVRSFLAQRRCCYLCAQGELLTRYARRAVRRA
jgi:hypothetical protein